MKILLVDDSKTMRNILKKSVAALGDVETLDAEDGVKALEAIEQHGPFELVLLDWNMPNMDGLSMLKKVREKDKTTPIIMVTTEAEKTRIIEAIKAGANNYIVKPFTSDTINEKIQETLEKVTAR